MTETAVLVVICLLVVYIFYRIRSCKKKISSMGHCEKLNMLDGIVSSFGLFYDENREVFSSKLTAWQRGNGYLQPDNNRVDSCPVYFAFEGKTWLIEFTKGNYGVMTGAETGVYHTEGIVEPILYDFIHFTSAYDYELLYISNRLMKDGKVIYENNARHWWLAGFRPEVTEETEKLQLFSTVTFGTEVAAEVFFKALDSKVEERNDGSTCGICGNKVFFMMCGSKKTDTAKKKLLCRWSYIKVKMYLWLSKPFTSTMDRILYLYFLMPSSINSIFTIDREFK